MNMKRLGGKISVCLGALLREETSGQALIEFALISPLILMLGLGIAVFGIGLNEDLMLTNSTEVASQLLAISRGQSTGADPCLTVNNAVVEAAPNLIPTNLKITVSLNGVSSGSLTGQPATSGVAMCPTMSSNMVEGANETVTVTYPYTASFINFGTKSYTLSASVEQQIE